MPSGDAVCFAVVSPGGLKHGFVPAQAVSGVSSEFWLDAGVSVGCYIPKCTGVSGPEDLQALIDTRSSEEQQDATVSFVNPRAVSEDIASAALNITGKC